MHILVCRFYLLLTINSLIAVTEQEYLEWFFSFTLSISEAWAVAW